MSIIKISAGEFLLPGVLGVSPNLLLPQEWGIKGVDPLPSELIKRLDYVRDKKTDPER
ncbi:MAG: hypothetical protein WC455_04295 [Dehalococcoidia bacterium]|jgi:hypothetical protein